MGLPLARIADARSRRNLIVVGITVWSAMTAVCGLAKGFWGLFWARVGVGVGEATLGPAAFSMITDYFPKSVLARALSVYMTGVTFGSGIAYMLGGAVIAYVETMGDHQRAGARRTRRLAAHLLHRRTARAAGGTAHVH
jgi:MFS family permease